MTTIVQVEFRESLSSIRDEILQSLGHPLVSVLGSRAARNLDLSHQSIGVILVRHGAPGKNDAILPLISERCSPEFPSWPPFAS
jgi:hypothetical protein